MNSDVEFVAVDMPQASRLTIHIIAAVAEHERELISQRTKAAMAAAKSRGAPMNRNTLGLIVVGSGILFVVVRRIDSPKLLLRGGWLPH